MTIPAADPLAAAMTLAAWLSPAYPVGGFAWSHGLETLVAEGTVGDAGTLRDWIADVLAHGAGWTDAVLFAQAFRGADVTALAAALATSAERRRETLEQGAAFASVTDAVRDGAAPVLGEGPAYPLAVARAAARAGIALELALPLWVQAVAASLVSAGVRLIPLGQTDGQRVLAALMPLCRDVAGRAATADPADLGGCAILTDIAAMRHEMLPTRLFRS